MNTYNFSRLLPYYLCLFALFFVLGPLASAPCFAETAKPLAADLVTDGQSIDIASERYQGLFKELRLTHNFTQGELDTLFSGVTIKRRVLELMDTQWEAKPYHQYYPRFVTGIMIAEGKLKLIQYRDLLDKVEKELGVEKEIVVAIWGIESRFGRNKGSFSMFQTLNTMFDAYPRRRDFYRKQLVHFLLLCRENQVDPLSVTGSYGGAFGQTQFIPSSFREYAVDFDDDSKRDVWESIPDILASIANYLRRFHWEFGAPVYEEIGDTLKGEELVAAYKKGRKGFVSLEDVEKIQGKDLPPSPENRKVTIVGLELENGTNRYVAGYPNFQAITAWNHSNRYAMAVTELAEKLAGK
ncbi:MAG: lytic murein transglycosylase [Desulfobulbaceae bacterium]|uniref:Lytic murein transglycosylase n=1 Tax=Candidatus Desulfobia pelagia TaxID=2841692 RepID=A0A8J6NAP7_9BACT|nr:lytic murein transglycosylase [Candidatus Desulfobia pelagia]